MPRVPACSRVATTLSDNVVPRADLGRIRCYLRCYIYRISYAPLRPHTIPPHCVCHPQARDPQAVQPHVRKCFEAIKSLDMKEIGKKNVLEAVGFKSPESEYVKLEDGNRVTCHGPVELWLLAVETGMCVTLSKDLHRCYIDMKKTKRERWISVWAGQLTLASGQLSWTTECTKALIATAEGGKGAMKQAKKKQVSTLNKLCDMVRGALGKLDRKKVVNIITVEVHSRDVIDRMAKSGCASVNDFEWLLQLRFYWEEGSSQRCVVKQTNTQTLYGYEYLGNPARLVVTPLTDRCYTTLTTALHLHRGGLPQGPAGTGKTETVKDLYVPAVELECSAACTPVCLLSTFVSEHVHFCTHTAWSFSFAGPRISPSSALCSTAPMVCLQGLTCCHALCAPLLRSAPLLLTSIILLSGQDSTISRSAACSRASRSRQIETLLQYSSLPF